MHPYISTAGRTLGHGPGNELDERLRVHSSQFRDFHGVALRRRAVVGRLEDSCHLSDTVVQCHEVVVDLLVGHPLHGRDVCVRRGAGVVIRGGVVVRSPVARGIEKVDYELHRLVVAP